METPTPRTCAANADLILILTLRSSTHQAEGPKWQFLTLCLLFCFPMASAGLHIRRCVRCSGKRAFWILLGHCRLYVACQELCGRPVTKILSASPRVCVTCELVVIMSSAGTVGYFLHSFRSCVYYLVSTLAATSSNVTSKNIRYNLNQPKKPNAK
jgi:hypothetical protein